MLPVFTHLHKRWNQPNGYRQVLAISLPLVASMGTITLMQFTDRIFLANYRVAAITAALPAGILSFTLISFFMGVAGYTNAFVAQYTGARSSDRVGAAIWQGIYFSFAAAGILALFYFVSRQLFDLIGHAAEVRELEIAYFIQMLGRLGNIELAATNIVFSIESLSFLPVYGIHIATTTLVGQAIGRGRPEDAVRATTSALYIALVYMAVMVSIFIVFPEPLLGLFKNSHADPALSGQIMDLGTILLRFVALFCLFDAMNLVFSGALKGAGDTRFILWTIAAISCGVMIVPIYLAVAVFEAGIYTAWVLITIYIAALGLAFYLRYRYGTWKQMRIIETMPLVGKPVGSEAH